jgi:tetratricopeptide (TPR) repeat protein
MKNNKTIILVVFTLALASCSKMIVGHYNGHAITLEEDRKSKKLRNSFNLGMTAFLKKDFRTSEGYFRIVLDTFPNFWLNSKTINNYCLSLVGQGKYDQAIECYEKAIGNSKYKESECIYEQNVNVLCQMVHKPLFDSTFIFDCDEDSKFNSMYQCLFQSKKDSILIGMKLIRNKYPEFSSICSKIISILENDKDDELRFLVQGFFNLAVLNTKLKTITELIDNLSLTAKKIKN